MNRKYLAILGVLVAACTVAILWLLSSDANLVSSGEPEQSDRTTDPFSVFNSPSSDPSALAFDGSVDKATLLQNYRDWAQYPPNSRPLKPEHRDVIRYREIPLSLQTMPIVKEGKIEKTDVNCLLQPEHHTVVEGESLRIFLACTRIGSVTPIPLRNIDASLSGMAGERKFYPVQSVGFNDSGKEGDDAPDDGIYTLKFNPQQSDWGQMYLKVNFLANSGAEALALSLSTSFFSSPDAPANFIGIKGDSIIDGSLIVTVEISVQEPGPYTIEANLMHNNAPMAYARQDVSLNPGRQSIELQFFGKIIADAKQDGPYTVTGLRGFLNTDVIQPEMLQKPPAEVARILQNIRDDRPKRKVIPYAKVAYATKSYSWNEFSAAPYDSREKQERIAELQRLSQ